MKRIISICQVVAVLLFFVACSRVGIDVEPTTNCDLNDYAALEESNSGNVLLWVAPNGNDDSSGTEQQPLATTQEALRRLRAQSYNTATILYAEGMHYLSEPISLEKGDHDIAFVSSSEGEAVISGAGKRMLSMGSKCGLRNWMKSTAHSNHYITIWAT